MVDEVLNIKRKMTDLTVDSATAVPLLDTGCWLLCPRQEMFEAG